MKEKAKEKKEMNYKVFAFGISLLAIYLLMIDLFLIDGHDILIGGIGFLVTLITGFCIGKSNLI